MNHTITDTTDTNILTAEEFLRQARRWAAAVRPAVHQGQEGHLHNQEERQGGAQAPQQHTVQDRA